LHQTAKEIITDKTQHSIPYLCVHLIHLANELLSAAVRENISMTSSEKQNYCTEQYIWDIL